MIRRLFFAAMFSALMCAGTGLTDDQPKGRRIPAAKDMTVEQLLESPDKFEEKTVVLKGVQISGTVVKGPMRHRLTIKSADGTVVDQKDKEQKVVFVTSEENADLISQKVKPDAFKPATLTCKIQKTKREGHWFAVVTKVDFRGRESASEKDEEKPAKGGSGKRRPPDADKPTDKGGRGQGKGGQGGAATSTIMVEGVGKNHDEAVKDALRNAVRQVVGAIVDADTLVKNDEVIKDQVLTYSDGIVKEHKEIGAPKREDGLIRVKIRATVQRRDVVAKLKAANIAVKQVKGQDLYDEVVTDIDREKSGSQLLQKKLKDFQVGLVKAEVVGQRKIKNRTERETTLEYAIRLSIREQRFDRLTEELIPVLEKVSSQKGEFAVQPSENDRKLRLASGGRGEQFQQKEFYEQLRGVLADDEEGHKLQAQWQPSPILRMQGQPDLNRLAQGLRGNGDEKMLMLVNVKRTKLDDRLTWKWYVIPTLKELAPNVAIDVVLSGKDGQELTSNHLMLNKKFAPGVCFERRYGAAKVCLSAYFGNEWILCRHFTITMESKIATEDLKKLKEIRCSIGPAQGGQSGTND